jgi:DNA polymerase III delta prime subunit
VNLPEECRPRSYDAVVGQDKAIGQIALCRTRGFGGRAILFSGATGTGKTTLAKLIAAEYAGEWATIEVDGKGLTADDVDGYVAKTAHPSMFGGHGWTIIVNEIQGLSKSAVTKLLTALESSPRTCWIFTTTADNLDALRSKYDGDFGAFIGRLNRIPLNQRGLCELFATMVHDIAEQRGLNGKPLSAYVRLLKECRNSAREALCQVEAGAMLP